MSNIEVVDNGTAPRVVCPACKTVMVFDITQFQKHGSQIMTDKCKGCKRDLFTCAIIMTNTSMNQLLANIQAIRGLYAQGGAAITDEVIANRDGGLKQ